MPENITISKYPLISNAEDYHFLRAKGIEYIEALGSKLWTDYNIHDPGITLLEQLCYAITDLAYRTSFDIKDLLAEPPGTMPKPAQQGFFTAREILTVNPWTTEDYRKLLIDIDGVKNGWLFCTQCPCDEMFLYANCKDSVLQYSPAINGHQIIIKGFYDVLIELENDEGAGDLNSGKIHYNFNFLSDPLDVIFATASIEMRLPSWQDLEENQAKYKSFRQATGGVSSVSVEFISGNKNDNSNIPETELARALRRPLYATIEVLFVPDKTNPLITETITFEDVPFKVWFNSEADRKALKLADLVFAIEDEATSGIIARYFNKVKRADAVIGEARFLLHQHRNLCEDFCSVKAIRVEDISVCADIDLTADSDIEKVLAQAYFLIDQYFSGDIRFYSLEQMLAKGISVDEVFEGPKLNRGFIDNDELKSTQLKRELFSSDIISLLMDIPGVLAVRNFVLLKYDNEGRKVQAESWRMPVSYNHQPRLYIEGSKFLVFKNGLPFLPDRLELADSLQVLKGENAQPKFSVLDLDLPVPEGEYFQLDQYSSIQNSLPLTYGLGMEGLPPNANEARRAQAKQLKAYLLVFEQFLVNYLEQLSKLKQLFSLDQSVKQSYFSRLLSSAEIGGFAELLAEVDGEVINSTSLNALTEDQTTFLNRRNRFLNHLMARFAEQFSDYALMLYSYTGNRKVADEILIGDKIRFLNDFPFTSSNRGKAFNYKDPSKVCSSENVAGLYRRIERLLGFKTLGNYFELYEEFDADNVLHERRWRLKDFSGKIYISGTTRYQDESLAEANEKAENEIAEVVKRITNAANYQIKKEKKWVLNLIDESGEVIATRKQSFQTEADAVQARDEIIEFARKIVFADKVIIVEHLLLRPRNKPGAVIAEGDPLLNVCIPPDCTECADEDPYSFRLTIVMNGEAGLANAGIAYRRFAEETIRTEVPAHLALKICWVSTQVLQTFEELYCDWLAELAREEPEPLVLSAKLKALLNQFKNLKSVYPKASLHDCVDGDDENRVYLNQSII